jgi:hypothetical protein
MSLIRLFVLLVVTQRDANPDRNGLKMDGKHSGVHRRFIC